MWRRRDAKAKGFAGTPQSMGCRVVDVQRAPAADQAAREHERTVVDMFKSY